MVVPRFVSQALSGSDITVYGDGNQSRCFCDVRDVIPAIKSLAESSEAEGRVFNIGAKDEISILDLARKVKDMCNSQSKIILVPYEQATEEGFEDMRRRIPDISRINDLIGWNPSIALDDTIVDIIKQFKEDGLSDTITKLPNGERVVVD